MKQIVCIGCARIISADEVRCPLCGIEQEPLTAQKPEYSVNRGNPKMTVRSSLFTILGLFVLAFVGAAFFISMAEPLNKSSKNVSQQLISEAQPSEIVLGKIGDTVNVGNFDYRVDAITFSKTIGNDYFKKTADGIYLALKITIKNKDREAHTLDNSLFRLTDSNNFEYESSNDGTAAIEMAGLNSLFLKQCQPHIETSGILVFEVPSRKGGYHLKVSGGFWSGKTGDIILKSKGV